MREKEKACTATQTRDFLFQYEYTIFQNLPVLPLMYYVTNKNYLEEIEYKNTTTLYAKNTPHI